MFYRVFKFIKDFLSVSVSDSYKAEFTESVNKTNITRAKITAAAFIFMEAMMLAVSFGIRGKDFFEKPYIYYGAMYAFLLMAMIVFLFVFIGQGKDIARHRKGIAVSGVFFVGIILSWCAGISLLDQLSSGQIIIYMAAIISVAVAPIYEPVILLLVYAAVHALFVFLLPHFDPSGRIPFGNFINSTTILVISWVISYMRYKKQVEDFSNRKIILDKSKELERINRKLEAANLKLEKLSQIDGLTGVYNRFVFDRTLKAEWDRCRRRFTSLSLIMVDIDFFKTFNDNYGHQAGDDCIRQVAETLLSCAKRSSDIVARYGGEEFAVIFPYMEKEHVLVLAEQMRKMVAELAIAHEYSSVSEYVTISLGVATVVPSGGSSVEEFIRAADKALYEAKQRRNNIVVA